MNDYKRGWLNPLPAPSYKNVEPDGEGWYEYRHITGMYKRIAAQRSDGQCRYISNMDLVDFAEAVAKSLRREP